MFRKKLTTAADTATIGLFKAGRAVGGMKGAAAANRVAGRVLGRHLEECTPACGWCNAPDKH